MAPENMDKDDPRRRQLSGTLTSGINGEVRKLTRAQRIKGAGVFLLGASAVVTSMIAWTLLSENADRREEQECRFDISAEVSEIADEVNVTTAEIFVAALREDEPETIRLVNRLDEQIQKLRPAIEERTRAVALCNQE